MTDYISREAAIDACFYSREAAIDACFYGWNNDAHDCAENIRAIPAADVRPVVRGKWKRINNRCDGYAWQICSECGEKGKSTWNFCRNCGADMREES